jgi:hypothetical protein
MGAYPNKPAISRGRRRYASSSGLLPQGLRPSPPPLASHGPDPRHTLLGAGMPGGSSLPGRSSHPPRRLALGGNVASGGPPPPARSPAPSPGGLAAPRSCALCAHWLLLAPMRLSLRCTRRALRSLVSCSSLATYCSRSVPHSRQWIASPRRVVQRWCDPPYSPSRTAPRAHQMGSPSPCFQCSADRASVGRPRGVLFRGHADSSSLAYALPTAAPHGVPQQDHRLWSRPCRSGICCL